MTVEKKKFTVEEDGFYGELFKSEKEKYPNKALVLCTGSDGEGAFSSEIVKVLNENGITILIIGFHDVPGTPEGIIEVPLEYSEKAAQYLNSIGYKKLGFFSCSMGSIFALLSVSYFPELFNLVIISSPLNYVYQAVNPNKRRIIEGKSSYTYRGKPIPYEPNTRKMSFRNFMIDSIKRGDMSNAYLYEELVTTAKEENLVPVEKMKAHVLIFSGKMDIYWPSEKSSEMIMNRLKKYNYSYPYEHISYDHAGHFLFPISVKKSSIATMAKFFKAYRKYPEENEQYATEVLNKMIEYFEAF
ncbi:alpha/beta-hydrolase [Anaeromyces robustus]|uniref:Alpha/beta-hydrolase n=1 Tax=Anaeromyces robustus TaxID=1754192 RepID=A0A1Y1XKP0_9FUNG|nr:alpha/beta-hydrolase [Anaeromyces robustus]|eukprot:ORX86321.1 alpha/beta-hydrolase [Anaeromyces robustus]